MQNYRTGNSLGSLLVKIALVIVGIIVLIWVAQKVIGFVLSFLFLAAIVIGIFLLIRFLTRSKTPRY
jgi:predicted membrane chloride channel (bestrophin family)